MKSKHILKLSMLIVIICFISISCVTNEKAPEPDPTPTPTPPVPKPVPVEGEEEPLNDFVKQAYESHKEICSSGKEDSLVLGHAGMIIYNEAYTILQWLSEIKKLKLKTLPPICSYSENKDTKNSTSNQSEVLYWDDIMHSIGLMRNYPENVSLQSQISGNSEAAGYYTSGSELKAVLVNKNVGFSEDNYHVLVHELTHALQDQNFSNTAVKFPLGEDKTSFDRFMAGKAMLEGDATLTTEYWHSLTDDDKDEYEVPSNEFFSDWPAYFIKHYLNGEKTEKELEKEKTQNQKIEKTTYPLEYNRSSILFQYYASIPFLKHNIVEEFDADKINGLFKKLPESSEHILHPQKYLDLESQRSFPPEIISSLNEFFKSKGMENVEDNYEYFNWKSIGEFGLANLIALYDIDFQKLEDSDSYIVTNNDVTPFDNAVGWDGDSILIYSPTLKRSEFEPEDTVFILLSYWDSQNDAGKYFERLSDVIMKKYDTKIEALNNDSGDIREFKLNLGPQKTRFIHIEQTEDQIIMIERYKDEMFDDIYKILFPESTDVPLA